MELKNDIHIIPMERGSLVYSPLRRGVFWANDEACQAIESYLAGKIQTSELTNSPVIKYLKQLEEVQVSTPDQTVQVVSRNRLVVLPSQICNLACTYCFASQVHSHECIDKAILEKAYDYILKSDNNEKYFSFIGGGEPMMTWDLLKWSFEYIFSHKSDSDKVFISITTNATLMNEDILSTIKKYGICINVSFDILKNIQDTQRPFKRINKSSFDIIHKNIQLLDKNYVSYGIRSTITMKNVSLMSEMVQFVVDNYPKLRSLHFEPVTDDVEDRFYQEYIDNFFQARTIAKSYGIDLYNSSTKSIFNIKEQFCNGELCLTPTGDVVACHRVSSKNDSNFDKFCYGKITEKGIHISQNKYQDFLHSAQTKSDKCQHCFAYWHCAGACPMERATFNKKQLSSKCEFIREIIKRTLLEYLKK